MLLSRGGLWGGSSFVVATVVFAVASLAASPAHAFCRTTTNGDFVPTAGKPCDDRGKPLFWASKCIGFSVQESASTQVDLATARKLSAQAFAEWSRYDCPASCGGPGKPSIAASDLGPVACDKVEHTQGGANANILVFRDGAWPHEGAALALTTVTYKTDSGEIYDADIEFQSNPAEVRLALGDPVGSRFDLLSILVHEAGHFFGLAHTQPTNGAATMFESYRQGQTFMRDLSPDDLCGICTAYPPKREAPCDSSPKGGFTGECGGAIKSNGGCGCEVVGASTESFALVPLGLAVAGALLRRRRR